MNTVEPLRKIEDIKEMKSALAYYGTKRDVFLFVLGILKLWSENFSVSDMLIFA